MLTAASRFVTNEDMAPDAMVPSPIEATSRRLNTVPLVLAVPETPEANWTHGRVTDGLGPRGHPAGPGLWLQTTWAITPERVPLGLLAPPGWARDPDALGQRARRQPWPLSQQERQQGLHRLDAVCTARACCPPTRMVSVGARAADGSDVVAAPRPAGVELLRRASWQRGVKAPPRSVWAAVAAQPVAAPLLRHVPRRGPPPAREATLARRSGPLTWCPPQPRTADGWPAGTRGAVQVSAVAPPAEAEPIAWRWLTTVAVETVADASARLQGYACRWGSAVWHRSWQSGCHLEARPFQKAER